MPVAWIENAILVILALYLARISVSHILIWSYLRRKREPLPPNKDLPPISIIKPVRGLDQEAEENFRSFIEADYPAASEVIFCVEERDDPAVPLIEKLIAEVVPSGKARLVFGERRDQSEMGKTINLIAGVKESNHEILVFSDSDARNSPGFLAELVRPLLNPKIGMTYACPVYQGARDWVAGMTALAVNETIIALATAHPSAAIGSALAIRKEVLDAIGGLSPLRHRIGIDAALGRAVYFKGFRIELIRRPVTIIHRHSTFRSWWQQMHRWLVTIRCYLGPRYFVIPFFGFPCFWASLYLILASVRGSAAEGLTVWCSILAVRLASSALVNHLFAREPSLRRYLWLAPLLDLLHIPLWLEAYANPYVVWRGRRYRVRRDATVKSVE